MGVCKEEGPGRKKPLLMREDEKDKGGQRSRKGTAHREDAYGRKDAREKGTGKADTEKWRA